MGRYRNGISDPAKTQINLGTFNNKYLSKNTPPKRPSQSKQG